MLHRIPVNFGIRFDLEEIHDSVLMSGHRTQADRENVCDFLHRPPLSQQLDRLKQNEGNAANNPFPVEFPH